MFLFYLIVSCPQVGSANTNPLQLFGPSIQPRHCLISLLEGVCTVTPLHADALTFVNGHHIQQPTILHVSTLANNMTQNHFAPSIHTQSPTLPSHPLPDIPTWSQADHKPIPIGSPPTPPPPPPTYRILLSIHLMACSHRQKWRCIFCIGSGGAYSPTPHSMGPFVRLWLSFYAKYLCAGHSVCSFHVLLFTFYR